MRKYEPIDGETVIAGFDVSAISNGGRKIVVYLKNDTEVEFSDNEVEGEFQINKLIHHAESNSGLDEYMKEIGLLKADD